MCGCPENVHPALLEQGLLSPRKELLLFRTRDVVTTALRLLKPKQVLQPSLPITSTSISPSAFLTNHFNIYKSFYLPHQSLQHLQILHPSSQSLQHLRRGGSKDTASTGGSYIH
jgi:hypothetical protein